MVGSNLRSLFLCLSLSGIVWAGGGPTNVLVLYNKNQPDSKTAADHYAAVWQVPEINKLAIDWPNDPGSMGSWLNGPQEAWIVSALKTPILAYIATNALDIRYIVLIGNLPFKLTITSNGSNQSVASYLAGARTLPYNSNTQFGASFKSKDAAGNPNFVVAHIYSTTLQGMLTIIDRDRSADATAPQGTIYFTNHVAGSIRNVRYASTLYASQEIPAYGVGVHRPPSSVSEFYFPQNVSDMLGLFTGVDYADADVGGIARNFGTHPGTFLPGSVWSNLTSWGELFSANVFPDQPQDLDFIGLGAGATAGTCEEPTANTHRFPHPRLFLAILAGDSVGEALSQSVYEPVFESFQLDPLYAPYAVRPTITLDIADGATIDSSRSLALSVHTQHAGAGIAKVLVYVDDKLVSTLNAPGAGAQDQLQVVVGPRQVTYNVPPGATNSVIASGLAEALASAGISARGGTNLVSTDGYAYAAFFPGAVNFGGDSFSVNYSATSTGQTQIATLGTNTFGGPRSDGDSRPLYFGRFWIGTGLPTFSTTFRLDMSGLSQGSHRLRLVAVDSSIQEIQGWKIQSFVVGSAGSPTAPTISIPPTDTTIFSGQSGLFNVTAEGTGPLAYQWQVSAPGTSTFTPIGGATGNSYTSPIAAVGDDGTRYRCVVTNSFGAATSAAGVLHLTLPPKPQITAAPKPLIRYVGQPAFFSVTAIGQNPLSYQWEMAVKGSSTFAPLNGATAIQPTYVLSVIAGNDDGNQYRCVVSNPGGSTTSSSAVLTARPLPPPNIFTQPRSVQRSVGQTATFSLFAIGNPPLTYQWQRLAPGDSDFTSILGAGSTFYTTPTIALSDNETQFRCLVTNLGGSTTSQIAVLNVGASGSPVIIVSPQSLRLSVGQAASFYTLATGAPSYQWQSAAAGSSLFSAIAGATSSTYTITSVTANEDGTQYRCIATNPAGSATTQIAVLTVPGVPSITASPQSIQIAEGQTATFSVNATTPPGSPLSYQWQIAVSGSTRFTAIAGATGSSYTTPAVTASDSGEQYRCVVTNSAGSATSQSALLTVIGAPVITASPQSIQIAVGQAALFSVTATTLSGSPLSYQWEIALPQSTRFTTIVGATDSSYTIPAVAPTDNATQYRCTVRNSAGGSTTSQVALLTVTGAPAITASPQSIQIASGETAVFTVTATGQAPLTYQWQKAVARSLLFTAIDGATDSSYATPAVTSTDNGTQYRCMVRNAGGSVTSSIAVLTVNGAPVITASPQSVGVTVGQTAAFSLTARGQAPLIYQWQKAAAGSSLFTVVAGATGRFYSTPALAAADNGNHYRCLVTNSAGSATSEIAVLSVNVPDVLVMTSPPQSVTILPGQTARFHIAVTGAAPLSYQWEKAVPGGSIFIPVSGATADSYTTPAATTADNRIQYRCVVTNAGSRVTSNAALLIVGELPVPSVNWPSVVGPSEAIRIDPSPYGSVPVHFFWNFVADDSSQVSGSLGVVARSGSSSYQSTAYSLTPELLNLSPGLYHASVYASAGGATSASSQGTITVVSGDLAGMRVYPNPFKADRHHTITFDRMTEQTTIKIYSITAQWIQTVQSSNGTASWNVHDSAGNAVASGVYLYLATDSAGHKQRGKIAVVH